jgi:hypothetical protein
MMVEARVVHPKFVARLEMSGRSRARPFPSADAAFQYQAISLIRSERLMRLIDDYVLGRARGGNSDGLGECEPCCEEADFDDPCRAHFVSPAFLGPAPSPPS